MRRLLPSFALVYTMLWIVLLFVVFAALSYAYLCQISNARPRDK